MSRWHRPAFLPQGRRLSEPVWQQRHRGLTWLLAAQVPALFVFGLIRGYGASEAAVEVSVVALSLIPALMPHLSRNVRSASTSLGLVISASVLVHLAGGAIEAHFEFFVVLALLALHQAWMPFLLALLYVVGEHGIVGVLYPDAVYNNPSDIAHPWK